MTSARCTHCEFSGSNTVFNRFGLASESRTQVVPLLPEPIMTIGSEVPAVFLSDGFDMLAFFKKCVASGVQVFSGHDHIHDRYLLIDHNITVVKRRRFSKYGQRLYRAPRTHFAGWQQ